jgi:poly(3-hydroxybutyrate) depolymerase
MAERHDPATPLSLTLMAGPIDARINPTKVNELATSKPIEWYEENLITTVPARYQGAGRRVYPGFVQVSAFMSMNPARHLSAFNRLYADLLTGDKGRAESTETFYKEYFAVLDMTAEFYLETVQRVFQEHLLPRGRLTWHDQPINLDAITRTGLLTVEGERDDICAIGQTMAAHDLCRRIKPFQRRHHLQAGVGHYGVFSGRRWETEVYPVVHNFIVANERTSSPVG